MKQSFLVFFLPFLLNANAATSSVRSDNYGEKCKGNVSFDELVECAAFKGIEVVNGGHGVAKPVSASQLEAISPPVLGCINLFLNVAKRNNSSTDIQTLVLANARALHSKDFRAYDSAIRIPVLTETVYMEEIKNNYYIQYEVPYFSVRECAKFLRENRAN